MGKRRGRTTKYHPDLIRAAHWLYHKEPNGKYKGLSALETAERLNASGIHSSDLQASQIPWIAALYQPKEHGKIDGNPLTKGDTQS